MEAITASDSVRIDKLLTQIPEIISKYDHYYQTKDQSGTLKAMRDEIAEVFEDIFKYYVSEEQE